MSVNLEELMARVAALESEAMAALSPSVEADAVDRFFHTQSNYPYFTNRLGPMTIDDDSEDLDIYVVIVKMRLLIGHITEAYEGEVENRLQLYIPQIITYFNERELLQSSSYPTALDDISPAGRCRIVACTGFAVFQQSGIGSQLVGAEFDLRCELEEAIEQHY